MMQDDKNPSYVHDSTVNEMVSEEHSHSEKSSENTSTDNASTREHSPQYGRMASEFPGWDPYVYGKPTKDVSAPQKKKIMRVPSNPFAQQKDSNGSASTFSSNEQMGNPFAQQGQFNPAKFGNDSQPQNNMPNDFPIFGIEIVPDDPQRNPYYGRWDMYAILAIAFAIFTGSIPFSLFFAIISLRRTKKFHMKGKSLAIISIILCIIQIAVLVYAFAHGITLQELYDSTLNWLMSFTGQKH